MRVIHHRLVEESYLIQLLLFLISSGIFTSDEDVDKLKEEVKSTDQIKADKARLEKENKALKKNWI